MVDFVAAIELGFKRSNDLEYFLEQVKQTNIDAAKALNDMSEKEIEYSVRLEPEYGFPKKVVLRRGIRGGMDPDAFTVMQFNVVDGNFKVQDVNLVYPERHNVIGEYPMLIDSYTSVLASVFKSAACGQYVMKYVKPEIKEQYK